jgi:hypothetical protein
VILELGIACGAGLALLGTMAVRAFRKRRVATAEPKALPEPGETALDPRSDPAAELSAALGEVIQVGDETRWPRSALMLRCDGELVCAVLLSREAGKEQATVAMAPPEARLYWLEARAASLPSTPPTRIDVEGLLLERRKMLPVQIEARGDEPPHVGESGRFALYEGSVADVAVVLQANETLLWYGRRVDPGDYDRLGHVKE